MKWRGLLCGLVWGMWFWGVQTQETNVPVRVIVVLMVDQNQLTNLLHIITNINSKIYSQQLTKQIIAEEQRILKLYDGLPTNFVANSTPENEKVLDKLIKLWTERDAAVSNLNALKMQLEHQKMIQTELQHIK